MLVFDSYSIGRSWASNKLRASGGAAVSFKYVGIGGEVRVATIVN